MWWNPFSWFSKVFIMKIGTHFESTTGSVNYEQVTALQTCIKILSDNIAKLPIQVKQHGKPATGHPLYDLLYYQPNNYQSAHTFFQTLEVLRSAAGNSFARIHRNNGFVTHLELLENGFITTAEKRNGKLYYLIDGKPVLSEDILHFKYHSFDGFFGLNPIQLTKLHWQLSGKSLLSASNVYDNGVLSNVYLKSMSSGSNNALAERAKAKVDKQKGVEKAGEIFVLPEGAELQHVPFKLNDLQWLEGIEANSGFIASLYGIPQHLITGKAPKYSNFAESLADFKQNTLVNITAHYQAELEMKLLTSQERKEGYSIQFDYSPFYYADPATRASINQTYFKMGILNGNQIAEREGLPSYPEGEQRYFESNNLQPINSDINSDINDGKENI